MIKNNISTNVVVIGSGPSGYSSALRCADLGLETLIIENYLNIGGVCLNVGCIPSKSLLHISKIINEFNFLKKNNIFLNSIKIDQKKIIAWKNNIIKKISIGLKNLIKSRNIKIVQGHAKFLNKKNIEVQDINKKIININFKNAIIATGSKPIKPLFLYKNNYKRIWNSTDALNLKYIPKKLLIIGGGIISLEMATIYNSFGSKIEIIEMSKQIISSSDEDIINIFIKSLNNKFKFFLETKVLSLKENTKEVIVKIQDKNFHIYEKRYDAVIIAIGRSPNINNIGIKNIGIKLENNFIKVNENLRTNIKNIYAIGDVIGQPMLAHKGIKEGHIVAEIISGKKYYFNNKIIPYIAYTDPEIAWVGLTEKDIKYKKNEFKITKFPWIACGKAIISGSENGITKLIFNKKSNRIVGGSVVGKNGDEIIGEICLAIEMGCEAEDIALTIHAHPTLYESICLSSEIYTGSITDIIQNYKK